MDASQHGSESETESSQTHDATNAKKTRGARSSTGTSKGKAQRSSRSTSSQTKQDDQSEQQSTDNPHKREAFTSTLERGLRSRLNGMVHHAQSVGTPKGVATVSDYLNQAVAEKLARDERRLNNGRAFPEPASMRTGRPQKRR